MSERLVIEFEWLDDEGNEVSAELPARYAVCRKCEGHGCHLRDGMREHAYTREEFELFTEEEQAEYRRRGGAYDVECTECRGRRVVLVIDKGACAANAELAELLKRYEAHQRDLAELAALEAAERRMGA